METTAVPRRLKEPGSGPAAEVVDADGVWARQDRISLALYWGLHASCLLAFLTGATASDLGVCFALVYLRLFGITGGYHRYFAHKSFKTSRLFQFVLALLGCSAVQKGPLWWAAGHRRHHLYSDQPGDMHSPRQGFWYAHQGWIFCGRWDRTELERVPQFACYPELLWLNRWHLAPPLGLALVCFALGGWSALVWGFAVSTVLVWHFTYSINSLAHVWGTVRYDTGDDSRNNFFLALLTLGEGWHNNHHKYMAAARNGFFWWEIDVTFYLLLALERLGLVWDLRRPPTKLLERSLPS